MSPVLAAPPALAVPHDATVLATGLQLPWGLVFVGSDALVGETRSCRVYRVARTGGATLLGTVGGGAVKLVSMALSPASRRTAWGHRNVDGKIHN